ncbi:MAG TPA: GNAT family N-acetyltransferase [Tepidiformaceae bacterium]|nr:GNAT family N-acetyltransferase [Tepidiformaceae bacterium]
MSEPIFVVSAAECREPLERQAAALLGRAYTDQRHIDRWDSEQHAALDPHVARIHGSPPADLELMPPEWLDHFPTLRNFKRAPGERREAYHFIAPGEGYLKAHVSLWPQRFLFGGNFLSGGYIEDVATDPLHLGAGLASAAMATATRYAHGLRLDLLGLATGIEAFYERLGWRTWDGTHRFTVLNLDYPDEPLMLLPLTPAGETFAANSGEMRSRRLWRFGEIPDDWP